MIALEALIELIAPFLPSFLDKEEGRAISILLLNGLANTVIIGGAFMMTSALLDVAIFGVKTATDII